MLKWYENPVIFIRDIIGVMSPSCATNAARGRTVASQPPLVHLVHVAGDGGVIKTIGSAAWTLPSSVQGRRTSTRRFRTPNTVRACAVTGRTAR